MKKHLIQIHTGSFPGKIRQYFEDTAIYDSSSSDRARVYYCEQGWFVKEAPKGTLGKEARMSRLFYERGLGVEVLEYLSANRDYLVTVSAEGQDLLHYLHEPELLCRVLAKQLHKLHSLPIADIPLSAAYEGYLDLAKRKYICERPNSWVLMEHFPVGSVEEAQKLLCHNFQKLRANRLIHGDACLPNIIMKNEQFTCFIDLGQSGLGDIHTDLYWALWSLQYNLKTEAYADLFLELYGRENYDPELLRTIAALEYLS